MVSIAAALGRSAPCVFKFLARHGGIQPMERRRNAKHLSEAEREEVSRGLARGDSLTQIARRLGRHCSTVSREVKRNGGADDYRATDAETRAVTQARRPKQCKLATNLKLRKAVAFGLKHHWSPQQIAGWLKRAFPDDESMHVSHETIYRTLFIQSRGVLKAELRDHLRSRQRMRRGRSNRETANESRIPDLVSIRERPPEADDRAVPGHWEGDLLMGRKDDCIATLVERTTRFVILVKVANKSTDEVIPALVKAIRALPDEMRRSLTWDRGGELTRHKDFTIATDIKVYFCDPHSPWQRGSNENTNGLLRQYFPKGEPIGHYSQADLNKVARELNERPRETLDFATPKEAYAALLQ